jgi:hypothetical protein
MDEDNRGKGFELSLHRGKPFVSEIDAVKVRLKDHAIGAQLLDGVTNFSNRPLHVRQRRRCEKTEPARIFPD